jgi:putative spermidine/putrescine transport system permease protein
MDKALESVDRIVKRPIALLMVAPALVVVITFFVVPLLTLLCYSLLVYDSGEIRSELTIVHYQSLLTDPFYLAILARTVLVAIVTTAICCLLGYPLALGISRASPLARPILITMVLTPLLIGGVVRSYGWVLILDKNGLINSVLQSSGLISRPIPLMFNFSGIVIAMVEVLLPFFVLPLLGALTSIDPLLVSAARSMGATATQAFFRVLFPLSTAGVVAGCTIVFSLALNLFEVPRIIGGPSYLVLATLAYQQTSDVGNLPFGSAIATLMLLLTLIIVAGLNRAITSKLQREG